MVKKKIVTLVQNPIYLLLLTGVFALIILGSVLLQKRVDSPSLELTQTQGGLYQYENKNPGEALTASFFQKDIPDHLYTLTDTHHDATITFSLRTSADQTQNNYIITQPSDTELILENAQPHVDLSYRMESAGKGVKEDIVIKDKKALINHQDSNPFRIQFEMRLHNADLIKDKNGGILPVIRSRNGDTLFELLTPYMTDSAGATSREVKMNIISTQKTLTQGVNETVYIISIIPDNSWLQDDERVYPIRIDPTVVKGNTPVGYWTLDEGYGTTTGDISGNTNPFTLNGSISWVKTDPGSRPQQTFLQFDGTNDSLSRAYDTDFDFGTGSFSVSTWFKHTSVVSGTDTLMARFNGAGWKIYMQNTGFLCFSIDDDATFTPDDSACSTSQHGSYADSKWHHLIAVKSGTSSVTLYIDGVQVAQDSSLTATASLSGTTPILYAGIDSNGGSNPWTGFIDTISIYNYARSSDQVKSDFMAVPQSPASFGAPITDTLTDGLAGWWKLDDTATPSVDSTGNGMTAAWNGNSTTTVGKFEGGISFDGTDDYLSINDNSVLEPSNDMTMAIWVKMDTIPTTRDSKFMYKRHSITPFGSYELMYDYDGFTNFTFQWANNSETWYSSYYTGSVSTNTWYHLVGVRKNNQLILYVNGSKELVQTVSNVTGTLFDSDGFLSFGGNTTIDELDGVLDDARLYNRALSEREVSELYQWSAPAVAHWSMDENTGTSSINDISTNANSLTINTPAGATVTFGAIVTGTAVGSPASVATATSVSAANNTLYITTVATKDDSAVISSISGLSLTWNLVDYQCSGRQSTGSRVYYAYGSPGSSGTVTANFSTPPSAEAAITVARYANTDPNDPIGAVVSSNQYGEESTNCDSGNSSADDTDIPFATLTTQRDNSYAFGAIAHRLRTLDTVANGFTERADFNSPGGGDAAGIAYIDKYISSAQSIGVGGTISSATDWALVAGEINGFNNGTVNWRAGKYGSAVELKDGGYLSRTDDADFDFASTDQFSISLWFKHETASAIEYLLTKSEEGVSGGYQIYMAADGDIVFAIDDDSTWTPDASITSTAATYDDNQWHHLTVVKNGTTGIYMYIDGAFITSNTSISGIGSLVNNDTLLIGIGDDEVSDYFNGSIDDVKIFRYPVSQKQIAIEMNAGHPLTTEGSGTQAGYWKMDEGYGTTVQDSSINALDASLGVGTSVPSWTSAGKYDKGLLFDGSNDYASIADNYALDIGTQSFTASTWVKTAGAGSTADLLLYKGADNATTTGYWWDIDTTGIQRLYISNGSSYIVNGLSGIIPVTDNQWHHLAFAWDPQRGATLYVDGQRDNFAAATSSSDFNSTTQLRIGGNGTNGRSLGGIIDELKIYHASLSASEILIEYNQGKSTVFGALSTTSDGITADNSAAREYCVPGDTSSCNAPVAEWKLDENTGTSTTFDTSGNGRNATLTSIVQANWVKGKKGSALELDGANDYIDAGTGPSTVNSISFWAYPETTTEYFMNLTATSHYIWLSSGTVTATGFTNPIIYVNGIRTSVMTQDQWSQVTVTTSSNINANNLEIGRTQNSNILQGKIDEIRLYDYVRTPAQLNWEYNRGEPLAWYQMDECSGTSIGNNAVNGNNTAMGNNGTLTIGATGPNTTPGTCTTSGAWFDGAAGKYNYSMDFDGTDDYVSVADTFDLRFDGTQDFTLMAWVKRNGTGSTHYIFSKEDADNDGYRLQIDSGNTVTCSVNATDITSTRTITDTEWHHVACVIPRGGNGQIYIDGFASGTATAINNATMATTTALRIASRSYTATNYFYGLIDDVRIYPYALTANQLRVALNENAINFR